MEEYSYQDKPPVLPVDPAKEGESRRLRRATWVVLLPAACFFAVTSFLREIITFIGTLLGASTEQLAAFTRAPLVNEVLEIVLSLTLFTIPYILFMRIAGMRLTDTEGFCKPKKGTVLPHLLIGIGFCSFSNVAVSKAGELLERFGLKDVSTSAGAKDGVWGFLMALLATAIVPALMEEFVFRGVLTTLLRPFGDAFCVLATAAVFGMFHGNFEQIPFAFIIGLALGYIRVKSGSVAVCMAVHAANNTVSVLLTYGKLIIPSQYRSLIYTVYLLFALIAAIAGAALLKRRDDFAFEPPKRALSAKETYAGFFLSPAIIIFFLMFLFRALKNLFL